MLCVIPLLHSKEFDTPFEWDIDIRIDIHINQKLWLKAISVIELPK